MLKINDNSISITLAGKGFANGDGVFIFAGALLIGAVAVAAAMSFLPRQLAMGALALLVVGMFVFNKLRQRQKQQKGVYFTEGVLDVRPGIITHSSAGRRKQVMVKKSDRLENHGMQFTVYDEQGQKKCHIAGFENAKEVEVLQQVLQGKMLDKRHANIKMQSN